MKIKDQISATTLAPKELRAMQEQAKKTGADKLSKHEIDAIIAQVRRENNPPKIKRNSR